VLEVVAVEDRLRGRVEEPTEGWISLARPKLGWVIPDAKP
jgi:hypothetical protein